MRAPPSKPNYIEEKQVLSIPPDVKNALDGIDGRKDFEATIKKNVQQV